MMQSPLLVQLVKGDGNLDVVLVRNVGQSLLAAVKAFAGHSYQPFPTGANGEKPRFSPS